MGGRNLPSPPSRQGAKERGKAFPWPFLASWRRGGAPVSPPEALPAPRSRRGEAARRLGLRTERLTLWLLWARGWDLVAWRQKVGRYELDLLVSRGAELRLLEIKARRPGAWVAADTALAPEQRLRLQRALRGWLDRVPWPGPIGFQRVSWAGFRCRFHPVERWDGLRIPR